MFEHFKNNAFFKSMSSRKRECFKDEESDCSPSPVIRAREPWELRHQGRRRRRMEPTPGQSRLRRPCSRNFPEKEKTLLPAWCSQKRFQTKPWLAGKMKWSTHREGTCYYFLTPKKELFAQHVRPIYLELSGTKSCRAWKGMVSRKNTKDIWLLDFL